MDGLDKRTFNIVKAAVAAGISMTIAFSAVKGNWALAIGTVLTGMVVLYLAKQRVDAVITDERSLLIREKAASATLNLVTVSMVIVGIILVETSFRGYPANRDIGYMMAFMANIILGVNMFFNWYYRERLGG